MLAGRFDREVRGQGGSGMQASSSRVSKAGCDVAAHAPTLEAVGDSPLLTALSASWAIEACPHHRGGKYTAAAGAQHSYGCGGR
eukprot:COSAG01_NODE_4841_length_4692_cov_66.837361_3_plen_84_part_00